MKHTAPRQGPVRPREPTEHEDAAVEHAELCIRVMERFFDLVETENLTDSDAYIDLWARYADVLQEELEPYAFNLAYHLFSGSGPVKKWRRDKDRQ